MQDPPEVRHEWQLKKYGRRIARQVSNLQKKDQKEPPPDFKKLRKLPINDKKKISLLELGISHRTLNALEAKGILFVGQLLQVSHTEILATKNLGQKTVEELAAALGELELLGLWDFGVE